MDILVVGLLFLVPFHPFCWLQEHDLRPSNIFALLADEVLNFVSIGH